MRRRRGRACELHPGARRRAGGARTCVWRYISGVWRPHGSSKPKSCLNHVWPWGIRTHGAQQDEDLGVKPRGTQSGIRKGGKGAVRLPRILVLTSSSPSSLSFSMRPVGEPCAALSLLRPLPGGPEPAAAVEAASFALQLGAPQQHRKALAPECSCA